MHRTTVALAATAFLAATGGALAAPAIAPPGTPRHAAVERVQYHRHPDWRGPRGFEGERWHRRQQRRAYEEDRIAEAARREAWRIERERAERRAWRHARRERHWRHNGF